MAYAADGQLNGCRSLFAEFGSREQLLQLDFRSCTNVEATWGS